MVQQNHTRVAVVQFSHRANVIFGLEYVTMANLSAIRERIQNLEYLDGQTNTSGALRVMRQEVFRSDRGDRPDIRNVGIIITDGHANLDENLTEIEANFVKRRGIRMFAIGLTTDINEAELKGIASRPSDNHYFTAEEISDVETFRTRLIWGVCNDHCATGKDCGRSYHILQRT